MLPCDDGEYEPPAGPSSLSQLQMAQLQAQYLQHQQQQQQLQQQPQQHAQGQGQGGLLLPPVDTSALMRDTSNASFLAGLPSGDYSNMGSGNFGESSRRRRGSRIRHQSFSHLCRVAAVAAAATSKVSNAAR